MGADEERGKIKKMGARASSDSKDSEPRNTTRAERLKGQRGSRLSRAEGRKESEERKG